MPESVPRQKPCLVNPTDTPDEVKQVGGRPGEPRRVAWIGRAVLARASLGFVRVGLLGPLWVVGDDGVELVVGAPKERAVLELLGVRASGVVTIEELVAALWGDSPPRSATKTLQNYVASLRRLLPAGVIETVPGGYRLRVDADQVDAACFAGLVDQGRRALEQADTERAVEALGRRCVCGGESRWWMWRISRPGWRRPPGWWKCAGPARSFSSTPAWPQVSTDRLIGDLEAAVAAEPLRERRWAQLMLALYRCGRQADALRAYQRLRTMLADELGIEPSSELRALEAGILNQDRSLQAPAEATALWGPARAPAQVCLRGTSLSCSPMWRAPPACSAAWGTATRHLLEAHRRLIRAAVCWSWGVGGQHQRGRVVPGVW